MRGKHPQTGEPVDEWSCAVAWMPILLVESTQAEKETGAAIESFRNEVVKPRKMVEVRPQPKVLEDGS